MSDVNHILSAIDAGDLRAAAELLPLVYDELRALAAARLAEERPGHTLQPTALVHEAYVRLVGGDRPPQDWNGRGHFFAAAAEAMRRILVEAARLVEMRFFLGLTLDEAAARLGLQPRTAYRDWAFARAWLRRELDCDR